MCVRHTGFHSAFRWFSLRMENRRNPLLKGTCSESGEFVIDESDERGVLVGRLTGSFRAKSNMVGRWSMPDGSKQRPLTASTFREQVGVQTKSITGKVIDAPTGMYAWAAIVVQAGTEKYFVYTLTAAEKSPQTVGTIDEVGRTVEVLYTSIVSEPGYAGRLKATWIVEITSIEPRL